MTVKIDVKGLEADNLTVFHDVDEQANGVGNDVGDTMVLVDQHFQFNLSTKDYISGTSDDSRYIACGFRFGTTPRVWSSAKGRSSSRVNEPDVNGAQL